MTHTKDASICAACRQKALIGMILKVSQEWTDSANWSPIHMAGIANKNRSQTVQGLDSRVANLIAVPNRNKSNSQIVQSLDKVVMITAGNRKHSQTVQGLDSNSDRKGVPHDDE